MVDDIRVFHHVAEPLSLPSSRFFGMAERLHLRGGAVARAFALALRGTDHEQPAAAEMPSAPTSALPDITELVGISGPNDRGIPWIEHKGGPA